MRVLKYVGIILGILVILVIGAYGAYFFMSDDSVDPVELTEIAEQINERETQVTEENLKEEDSEEETELDMKEKYVQTYIHHMTHQHIKADKKWGNVESSPQNIASLLTIVQANQDVYEHGDYYIEVLALWQQGNFDNAVSVHNFIWKLKGGTVGRATRLLTEEEKEAYLKMNFPN